MLNKRSYLLFLLLGIFMISSCGKDEKGRLMNEYLSAFLKTNDSVIVFGSADLNTILQKTDYRSDSKLRALLDGQLADFRSAIDTTSPVYFAVEGPIENGKNPKATYLFLDVKSEDSLVAMLTKSGFDFSEEGEMKYHLDGDVAIGVDNDLAIMIGKGGEFDGKQMLISAFERSRGEMSGGKIDAILAQKADIVLGTNLKSLYGTSNTDLSKLDADKQKELKAMVEDSYIQTTFKFETGSATIESKHLFNEDLKRRLFFREEQDPAVLKSLGNGSPSAGMAINLDLSKLESLLSDYSPETLEAIAEKLEINPTLMKVMSGNNLLSNIADGKGGMLLFLDQENFGFGVNMYLGLEAAGREMFPLIEPKIPIGFNYSMTEHGVLGYTMPRYKDTVGGSIDLPEGCGVFGKKGFTAFASLDGIDIRDFGMQGSINALSVVRFLTIELDENGSKIYLQAKDKDQNILKQALGVFMEEIKQKIGNIAV